MKLFDVIVKANLQCTVNVPMQCARTVVCSCCNDEPRKLCPGTRRYMYMNSRVRKKGTATCFSIGLRLLLRVFSRTDVQHYAQYTFPWKRCEGRKGVRIVQAIQHNEKRRGKAKMESLVMKRMKHCRDGGVYLLCQEQIV